jgi:hypothetical protein
VDDATAEPNQALARLSLAVDRNWGWVITGFAVMAIYALIFGPTLRL